MASNRVVKVSLLADVSGFMANVNKAKVASQDFAKDVGKSAKDNKQDWDQVGLGLTAVGIAAGIGVGAAVTKFAEFDQAMSAVQASTHETSANMGLLRDAALQAGSDTAFSATEAANAIDELSKAGVSTKDIIGGGLTGALDLASAGSLGVARAAEIAATTMSQFQLKGTDAAHVADVLAAGAGKAQGSVDDLANGLKYVGPVAASMGLGIEEVTGTLALFATQGIIGEQAGTSLRGVLSALTAPSAAASREIEKLGLKLYDSSGEFVGMENVAGQLAGAYDGMDTSARQASLGVIFGAESITAATTLYQAGAKGVAEWTGKVDDSGYAAETARMKLDNLAGDVDALGGSFETALIKSGSAGNETLRALTQAATAAVDLFSAMPQPVQSTALAVSAVGAAAALAGGAFFTAVPKIVATKLAFDNLMGSTSGASRALSGVGSFLAGPWGVALGIATVAVGAFVGEQAAAASRTKELGSTLDATTSQITSSTAEMVKANLAAKQMFLSFESDSAFDSAEKLGLNLDLVTRAALGELDALKQLNQELSVGTVGSDRYNAALEASGLSASDYTLAVSTVTKEVTGNSRSIEEAIRVAQQKQNADAGSAEASQSAAEAYLAEGEAVGDLTDQLTQLMAKVDEANGKNQDAVTANLAYQQSIDDVDAQIQKARDGIEGYSLGLDENTQTGRDNYGMLIELAKNGRDVADAQFQATGNTAAYKAALDASKQAVYDRALALTGNADAAQAVADNIAEIPSETEWKVITETAEAQRNIDMFVRNNNGRQITITVNEALGERVARGPGGSGGIVATSANGNIFAYANGGFPTGIYAGRAGSIHKFAEPETRWEAYISGKPGQERRNIGIWADAGKRLGVFGGSRPSYVAAGYGGSRSGAGSTTNIAPVVNQNGVFYSYDPSRMAKDISRKQTQALALYGDN